MYMTSYTEISSAFYTCLRAVTVYMNQIIHKKNSWHGSENQAKSIPPIAKKCEGSVL